jgi:glutathione S-transferase
MIKLYDFKSSPNCQRVKVVLAEKNLPYEIVPVDLAKKEQKNPEYLKMNPYGKVPVLTDDSTVLYESLIINEYLEEKYPAQSLLPKDPAKKAEAKILELEAYLVHSVAHSLDIDLSELRQKFDKTRAPPVRVR